MKKSIQIILIINLFAGLFFTVSAQSTSQWEAVPDEVKNTNAYQRYEWFYRNRLNNTGDYPKTFIEQQKVTELNKVKPIIQKLNKLQTTSDIWTNIGPKAVDLSTSFISHWGKSSGRVRGLAVHPQNPNIVYIGFSAGGIWKTYDGGQNWIDLSSDLNLLTFGGIAIDPNNPNTIYAGTGEAIWNVNPNIYEGDGLYKSTDGGVSWVHITNGFGSNTQFSSIAVNPHDSNIILAALGSGNFHIGDQSNEGIWRSEDGGLTWTKVIGIEDACEVAFDPTANSTRAYAGTGGDTGFFVSYDEGEEWSASNIGLPSSGFTRIQFSISKSSPSTIYSIIYPGATFNVYKSTNYGNSWSPITPLSGTTNQGWYDLCLAVNPIDPDYVLFGNSELARTTDGDTISFIRNSPPVLSSPGYWDCPVHVDIHKIVYSSNPAIVYLACDGGIYKSLDSGSTWIDLNNNLSTLQMYRVASDPSSSNVVYGGAQDNGNFSSQYVGTYNHAWVLETSGDGMECFVDYNNSNTIFMSTQKGNLLRSTDAGVSWSKLIELYGAWTTPYWQHPTKPNYIYAANTNIYRSTSNGDRYTWSTISGYLGNKITSVAHSAVNTNKLMAAQSEWTTTPSLLSSSDEGVTWTNITANVTTSYSSTSIQRVVPDPIDSNTFYICRASYGVGQLLKTTDFGITWQDISNNLPKITHNDLFVDPLNGNHLYAANDFGVYWSNNGGSDWHKLSNGMPFVPVLDFDLYQNGSTRLLRAASHGRGVYELQIDSPLQKLYVDLKVILEGAYENSDMKTAISESIPNNQPFNTAPWNYSGTESASITAEDDIVDWVLVQLRTGSTPSTATNIISVKAALLKKDGSIVDSDGITNLNFDVDAGNYYIVIYHRNHIPIMTPTALTIN